MHIKTAEYYERSISLWLFIMGLALLFSRCETITSEQADRLDISAKVIINNIKPKMTTCGFSNFEITVDGFIKNIVHIGEQDTIETYPGAVIWFEYINSCNDRRLKFDTVAVDGMTIKMSDVFKDRDSWENL